MKITVDVDRMRIVSGEIRNITAVLQSNMDAMEFLVNSMNGEWQGDSERAYAARLIYVRREFKEIEHFFEEYASLLNRFAEEYQSYEDQLAAKIRNV